jgi:tetrapyrrole methylase family protein/MazG family protein
MINKAESPFSGADDCLYEFQEIVARLRDKENGCPWDLKQTHESLKPYFLEEVYEFFSALDDGDVDGMEEELGDVLLQIYLHVRLLEEKTGGRINIDTVARKISDKMQRRHPHIFQKDFVLKQGSPEEVEQNWKKIKDKEKGPVATDVLHKYRKYPLLARIEGLYRDIKRYGFRFENRKQSLLKVQEELEEAMEKLAVNDEAGFREELGDLLLAVCSAAVESRLSPEELLLFALRKFEFRYRKMMEIVDLRKLNFSALHYEEKRGIWEEAKRIEAADEVSAGRHKS